MQVYLVITQPWDIYTDINNAMSSNYQRVKIDVCKNEEDAKILVYKYKMRRLFYGHYTEDYHGNFDTISLEDYWGKTRTPKATKETVRGMVDEAWKNHMIQMLEKKMEVTCSHCNKDYLSELLDDEYVYYYQALGSEEPNN